MLWLVPSIIQHSSVQLYLTFLTYLNQLKDRTNWQHQTNDRDVTSWLARPTMKKEHYMDLFVDSTNGSNGSLKDGVNVVAASTLFKQSYLMKMGLVAVCMCVFLLGLVTSSWLLQIPLTDMTRYFTGRLWLWETWMTLWFWDIWEIQNVQFAQVVMKLLLRLITYIFLPLLLSDTTA